MRTEKQRQASRRNGALSRGPKTPEGKARSAENARTHGIFARAIVLPNESEEAYENLRERILHDLAPATSYEAELALEVVACRWRMRRTWVAETANIAVQIESMAKQISETFTSIEETARAATAIRALVDTSKALNGLRRYEASLARQAHDAEKRLAALQHERLQAEAAEIPEIPEPVEVDEVPRRQTPVPAMKTEPTPHLTDVDSTRPSPHHNPGEDRAA